MITLEEVIKKSGIHPSRVQNVYLFGSQIYGTTSDKSDFDILIIAKAISPETELVVDNFNMHILTIDRFMEGLRTHQIGRIECLLSPIILKEDIKITLVINIPGLRHMVSHTCSNSWVKAKKKIEQGDYYIGIKSMFHALRIAMFGIQIAETGKIYNWSEANYIWNNIMSKTWSWEQLDLEHRELRNKLMTKFRILTTKL